MIRVQPELISIARRKFSNLIIDKSTVGSRFGLMNLYYVLSSIGQIVTHMVISMESFPGGVAKKWNSKLKYCVLQCVCKLTSLNLQSLTVLKFGTDLRRFEPLVTSLNDRDVVLNIS